jgi:multidrug efflux pump subunit AcrA (membrane-fusion protein)
MQAHLESSEALLKEGMIAPIDLNRIKSQLSNLEHNLIKAENGYKLTMYNLNSIMGIDLNTELVLENNLSYEPCEINLEDALIQARENRMEMMNIAQQRRIMEEMVDIAKSNRKPQVMFSAESGGTGWQAVIVAEYSLFDGGVNKAKIEQAEIKLAQVDQSEKQVQQLIEFEVRSAYLNMKEAEKLIKVAEEGIKNSQESFRIAQVKYNAGIATNTEVIDAQSTLIEAETNHLNALYDYNINRAAIGIRIFRRACLIYKKIWVRGERKYFMKIKKRTFFFIFLFIVIIGLLAFRIVNRLNERQQEEVQKSQIKEEIIIPVRTALVEKGEVNSFLKVTGVVEANETVRVTSEIMGQAKEVKVKDGEEVNKGDILIVLGDEQTKIQVAQAQATLDSVQASYDKIKSGARPQEIKQAESAVLQAKINRDSAEENYLRMKKLFTEKAISEQQYEQAKNQYEIADVQYQSAQESYELVIEGAAEEDVKSVEAQVRQTKSALDMAKYQLKNTQVTAPISGKVTSIAVSSGEMVSPSVPLLSIIDVNRIFVKVGISEKDISKIKEGQTVDLKIDAFPEEKFLGEVVSKGVAVDQISKTLEVKIEILQPEVDIPVGVFARGDILVKTNQDALIIPSSALTRKKDGIYIYVIEEGIARQKEVVLGIIQDERVEILEGLSEEEEIVVLGNQELEDGLKVDVLNKEE